MFLLSPGSIRVKFILKMKQPEGQNATQVYHTTSQAIIASSNELEAEMILDDFTEMSTIIGNTN